LALTAPPRRHAAMSPATAFDRATAVTRLDGEEIRAPFDAEAEVYERSM
jgi:hypothetical protein